MADAPLPRRGHAEIIRNDSGLSELRELDGLVYPAVLLVSGSPVNWVTVEPSWSWTSRFSASAQATNSWPDTTVVMRGITRTRVRPDEH